MSEGILLALLGGIGGLLWSIAKQLEKLNASLGGLRWQLEQMDERQQRATSKLYEIAGNTDRLPERQPYEYPGDDL